MPSDNAANAPFDPKAEARRLARTSRFASLGTLDPEGRPYVSLVSTATDVDGSPLLLISRLALHTSNLEANPAASLLFSDVGAGDPMVHPRVSLRGDAARLEAGSPDGERAKRRFLARHPDAAFYAGFADFAFWTIAPQGAHLVAGFGRIVDLSRDDLVLPRDLAQAVSGMEADAVSHVNEDHKDTVALYATHLLGRAHGAWTITGVDPEGCDLAMGDETARLIFPGVVKTPGELRSAFRQLAEAARAKL